MSFFASKLPYSSSDGDNAELLSHTSDNAIHTNNIEKNIWNNKYSKPANGIPKSDLTTDTQTSLNKAYTSIQSIQVEKFIATANQKLFTLTNTYELGKNRLRVTVGGSPQYIGENYTETSNKSITFTDGLDAGIKVVIEVIK